MLYFENELSILDMSEIRKSEVNTLLQMETIWA